MTRAADMLWSREEQQARAVFTEAIRPASRSFRERSGEPRGEPRRAARRGRVFNTQFTDQRGVGFGLWPARKAARLNPVEVLCYQ